MKQSKDPFEVAFEEQDESPPDSPDELETENQAVQLPVNVQGDDDVNNSIRSANRLTSTIASIAVGTTAPANKTKEDDDEEEEENMDVELEKFPSSGDPDKTAKMQ
ncbi:unnamed protein product [Ilex paraguariensis]|uniref:Uncharacterized protein n=1 Tax=Ilex paraguariensis TaxID=185542 RepID=A0ABC8SPK4_9AQUA